MTDYDSLIKDLKDFERNHTINGTIALALDDKIVCGKGFGIADFNTDIPCMLDTQYNIASVTKQFTSAALLRVLYESNSSLEAIRNSLKMPISQYLPAEDFLWDEQMPEWAHIITPHQLLTHTSGLVNYTDLDSFWEGLYPAVHPSRRDLINLFKEKPLNFEPGSRHDYCNSGYFLLGEIISRLSKKSLNQYFMDTFFTPLGMKNSSLPLNGTTITLKKLTPYSNLARGYTYNTENSTAPYKEIKDYWPHDIDLGDGGIISTAQDLIKWNVGLYNGRILPRNVLELMLTPYEVMSDDPSTHYGYGLIVKHSPCGDIFSHGGGIPGYRTYLFYIPSIKLTAVSMSNVSFDLSSNRADRDSIRKEISHMEEGFEKERMFDEIYKSRYPEVHNIIQKHSLFLVDDLKSLLTNR